MRTSVLTAAAMGLLLVSSTTAKAQFAGLQTLDANTGASPLVHKTGRRSRRNGRIAAGVVAGVVGAIAVHELHRSARRREARRWSRHQRNCRRWLRWCRNGSDRACWRYDNRCY